MMAAILNSAILDSDTVQTPCYLLRFTQKHSHSLTLTQTHSLAKIGSHHCCTKKTSLIHSDSTWWWQPSWILPSWIQPFCLNLNTQIHSETVHSLWLVHFNSAIKFRHWPSLNLPRLVHHLHKKLLSFILTQLDDGSHLEFSHFAQKKLHSFILIQLDDGSHLEFCHLGFSHFAQKNFTHSFWLNLMMAAILNSAMLDSDTLPSSLRFTQKHRDSNLTLTQTNSIWQKLIHSHLTWWWQPSWILPCSIPPSWIQPS